ncbi:squamosa promoter-binding-like protein 2 [Vicia villosa]|uniref:squamosa promoter-binding-like protein 2 n=1 Tax=Vicia villosa TaxID=3911 RepID=UPI00273CE53D|nr:squamosa promoter-binding-like protein 2 [Vicia villosa]
MYEMLVGYPPFYSGHSTIAVGSGGDGGGGDSGAGEQKMKHFIHCEASDSLEKSVRDTTGRKHDDSKGMSSFSGSSKRSRVQNRLQNMIFSVDGCNTDLSDCREYHKQHRVCEKH